jgi:hypothetical protein
MAVCPAMALSPLFSEHADFCPVCDEMAVLCWIDRDLAQTICDDCAECLGRAESLLLKLKFVPPSLELIDRNP